MLATLVPGRSTPRTALLPHKSFQPYTQLFSLHKTPFYLSPTPSSPPSPALHKEPAHQPPEPGAPPEPSQYGTSTHQ